MDNINTKNFIEKAIKKHGDKYDYSLVDYADSQTKVSIVCKIHSVFVQSPSSHLQGRGCYKCSKSRGVFNEKPYSKNNKKTTFDFIRESILIHGNRYNYDKSIYLGAKIKVLILCKKHGFFEQQPTNHLNGQGCPKCFKRVYSNTNSWSASSWDKLAKNGKHFDSFKVYIIRCWNDNEEFYKIGRTYKTVKKRFCGKSILPYNYEIIIQYDFNTAKEAHKKETELKRLNIEYKYMPTIKFDGFSECFSLVKYK